jgi:hypothetical protein
MFHHHELGAVIDLSMREEADMWIFFHLRKERRKQKLKKHPEQYNQINSIMW